MKGFNKKQLRRWFMRRRLYFVMYGLLIIIGLIVYTLWPTKEEQEAVYVSNDIVVISLVEAYVTHIEEPIIEAPIEKPLYTEEEIVMVASILEAECWDTKPDWRKEATVIMNRLSLYKGHPKNPDGTLKGVIHAGNGSQFNGIRTKGYRDRVYSDKAYEAAYDVLINGYRAFDGDTSIIHFANIHTVLNEEGYDVNFVNNQVEWVYLQNNHMSHSFGRDLK